MQDAFVEFVGRLDPGRARGALRARRPPRQAALGRQGAGWELYGDFYRNLVEKPAEHMPHTFVEAFSLAYREYLNKKKQS